MRWTVHLHGGPQRVNHAAVAIGKHIYSFGGYCSSEGYEVTGKIDVHVLDTDTLRWNPVYVSDDNEDSDIPFKCYGHTVVAYGTNVYLWGGRNDLSSSNTLHCFNVVEKKWTLPAVSGKLPEAVDGHSACIIADYMYVFGGYKEDSETFSEVVHRLHLVTLMWEEVATNGTPPCGRDFHSASAIGSKMYIFGGRGTKLTNSNVEIEQYSNKIMYLDTENMTWVQPRACGEAPSGRRSHSAVVYNDEVYIFGGYNATTLDHMGDMHKYNPVTNYWVKLDILGTGPKPRRRHCSCVVGDKLYLFGGSSPSENGQKIPSFPYESTENYQKLIDHSDLHVMDFTISLKRLCQLKIINDFIKIDCLPKSLIQELKAMTIDNSITTEDFNPRRDFGLYTVSA